MVYLDQEIHNGRGKTDLTLDDASFELVEGSTKLSKEDFYKLQAGDQYLYSQYHQEVENFVRNRLGCDKAIAVHSQVRNASKLGQDGVQGYASGGPHTASSAVSGDLFALLIPLMKTNSKRATTSDIAT